MVDDDEVRIFVQLLVSETIVAAETDMETDDVGIVIAGAKAGEVVEPGNGMTKADAVDFPYEGVAGTGIGDKVLFIVHKVRVGSWRRRRVLVMECFHIPK